MKAQIVSFNCVLKDALGHFISSSYNHDVLTEINDSTHLTLCGKNQQFPEPLRGLIEGLKDLKEGEKRSIVISADRAYGYYDPGLVMEVSRKKLPEGEFLETGFQVFTQAEDGETKTFRVIDCTLNSVTLDGNHPLAGQDLCFDIEATAAREATEEEIKQSRIELSPSLLH